jgi:hypothetical protein
MASSTLHKYAGRDGAHQVIVPIGGLECAAGQVGRAAALGILTVAAGTVLAKQSERVFGGRLLGERGNRAPKQWSDENARTLSRHYSSTIATARTGAAVVFTHLTGNRLSLNP